MSEETIEQQVKSRAKAKIHRINTDRKVYSELIGKQISLGSSVFWSNGSITLSAFSNDEKQPAKTTINVEEDMNEKDLMDIFRAVRSGTLIVLKNNEKREPSVIQLNDENVVKEYSTYDDILTSVNNRASFIKKMEDVGKKRKIDIKFLEKLREEELSGDKREDIVEEIDNMIKGYVKI